MTDQVESPIPLRSSNPPKRSCKSAFGNSPNSQVKRQRYLPTPQTSSGYEAANKVGSKEPTVEKWLESVDNSISSRPSSCPPRLEDSVERAIPENEDQQPLLRFLQEMPAARQTQASPTVSSTAAQIRQPNYRRTLRSNGVIIDGAAEKIPATVQEILDIHILIEREVPLPEDEIRKIRDAVKVSRDLSEGGVSSSLGKTNLLPVDNRRIAVAHNTPWKRDYIPEIRGHPLIAAPKTDLVYGFVTNGDEVRWSSEEIQVLGHIPYWRLAEPTFNVAFPFLVFELKSEALGGNLYWAENQAAGSGSTCVNILRALYQKAEKPLDLVVAFSGCLTHREVVFHVHFYSDSDKCFCMSHVATFRLLDNDHIQKCRDTILNISDYATNVMLPRIREAVMHLYPPPQTAKRSQPAASQMDSPEEQQTPTNPAMQREPSLD